jgi:hypothetical protein
MVRITRTVPHYNGNGAVISTSSTQCRAKKYSILNSFVNLES